MKQSIHERWSKICERQSLKNLKWYGLFKPDHATLKFFKGCLPQILLDPFLNTLSHITITTQI